MVEHILGKDGVVSPILTGGTIFVASYVSLECSAYVVCYSGKKVEEKRKPLSKSKKFVVCYSRKKVEEKGKSLSKPKKFCTIS